MPWAQLQRFLERTPGFAIRVPGRPIILSELILQKRRIGFKFNGTSHRYPLAAAIGVDEMTAERVKISEYQPIHRVVRVQVDRPVYQICRRASTAGDERPQPENEWLVRIKADTSRTLQNSARFLLSRLVFFPIQKL